MFNTSLCELRDRIKGVRNNLVQAFEFMDILVAANPQVNPNPRSEHSMAYRGTSISSLSQRSGDGTRFSVEIQEPPTELSDSPLNDTTSITAPKPATDITVTTRENLPSDFGADKASGHSQEEPAQRSPKKRIQKRISDTSPNNEKFQSSENSMTIQELAQVTDIDDDEARKGFIDDRTGEKVYLIDWVVKYEPSNGYLVHWKGFRSSDRTWVSEKDMPPGFAKEMKKARERYIHRAYTRTGRKRGSGRAISYHKG